VTLVLEPPARDEVGTESPRPPGRLDPLRHTVVIARRSLLKVAGDPALLLDATLLPIVFSALLVYLFGGALAGDPVVYRQYLIPGLMTLTVAIVSRATGIGVAVDFGTGVMDRFRALPISPSAVLAGRVLADAARMLLSQVVILGFACLIGFRITTDPVRALAAVALIMAFGVALAWGSTLIGLTVRSVAAVETITTLVLTPLQFGSSLFVSPSTMPGWLEDIVRHNPMTLVADAARALLIGGPAREPALGAAAWIAVALIVLIPLSARRFGRRR
jgi:oleandomycin transport system permease protein